MLYSCWSWVNLLPMILLNQHTAPRHVQQQQQMNLAEQRFTLRQVPACDLRQLEHTPASHHLPVSLWQIRGSKFLVVCVREQKAYDTFAYQPADYNACFVCFAAPVSQQPARIMGYSAAIAESVLQGSDIIIIIIVDLRTSIDF